MACCAFVAGPASAQLLPVPEIDPDLERQAKNAMIYRALSSTPVGALAPVADLGRLSGLRPGLHLTGHVALVDQEGMSHRNFALGLGMPVIGGTLRGTVGVTDHICEQDEVFGPDVELPPIECKAGVFGGLDVTVPLITPAMTSPNGGGFGAGLALSVGASTNNLVEVEVPGTTSEVKANAQTMSAAIGVPLSFVARAGDVLIVPHVTPRFAYGHSTMEFKIPFFGSDEETEDGFKFMVGAGLDILMGRSGWGLGLGLQRFFDVDDAEMTVGFTISYRAP